MICLVPGASCTTTSGENGAPGRVVKARRSTGGASACVASAPVGGAAVDEEIRLRFKREREPKNTVRFEEGAPECGQPSVIGTFYLQKWVLARRREAEAEVAPLLG
jgi:hypothetical protein